MVPSEDGGDVLVRRHSLPNPPATQKEDSTHFPSAPPPARTVLCFAGQPVLCRTACIVAAAGPPAVRAQPNGDEDDDKEAISSAATILTVCCCGYQWWTCYCCFHCYLEFRKYLVADKLQRNRSIVPPAMFLCICTMLYVVICFCRLLLLYSRIPRPPLPCDDPSAAYFYCALNGSPQLS